MLFTFILNYKGKTCIRQVRGSTLKEAAAVWVKKLRDVKFGGDEKIDLTVLTSELADNQPVLLNEHKNVWCAFLKLDGNAVLNVVLTTEGAAVNEDEPTLV